MNKIKSALAYLVVYLSNNPGTATMFGGFAVVALAKLGLHVSISQLYAIIAVLLPVIAGGHLAARHVRESAIAAHHQAMLHAVISAKAVIPLGDVHADADASHVEVPDSPEGIDDK
jgi:hypothetical protein